MLNRASANETLIAPNVLSFYSLAGPGCVCLRPTEPNQADSFLKQQSVMLLAQALRRGGGARANAPQRHTVPPPQESQELSL